MTDTRRTGRPLSTRPVAKGRGWEASLPTGDGKRRKTYRFTTEAVARQWLTAGGQARRAGLPLPTPDQALLTGSARRSHTVAFDHVGSAYADQRFEKLMRGDGSREDTVRRYIKHIDRWMTSNDHTIESMTPDVAIDMFCHFVNVGNPLADESSAPMVKLPADLSPGVLLTRAAALRRGDTASASMFTRKLGQGKVVPPAGVNDDGQFVYRVEDIFTHLQAGQRRGPKPPAANSDRLAAGPLITSQDSIADMVKVFQEVMEWAKVRGYPVAAGFNTIAAPLLGRPGPPTTEPALTLTQCAALAAHMHVVHQLALWLLRILGLRISEAYGLRVRDIIDFGDDRYGLLAVRHQGGKKFKVRNRRTGKLETREGSDKLKNRNSYRLLVIAPPMMALIRTINDIFHTTDGVLDRDARLISGLTQPGIGGQASFRSALSKAVVTAGLDLRDDFVEEDDRGYIPSLTPHHMRRSAITFLAWSRLIAAAVNRFAGHAGGASVAWRHYILDHPEHKEALQAAEVTNDDIIDQLEGNIMVPTSVRCTTGNQPALAPDAARIDAELAGVGWLTGPMEGGPALLDSAGVARELSVTPKTAREWMRDGSRLRCVQVERQGRAIRFARVDDVLELRRQLRERRSVGDLADELGRPYDEVLAFIHSRGLSLERIGARGYAVTPHVETETRAHFSEQDALAARAVRIAVAATMLATGVDVVEQLVAQGQLLVDDVRGPRGSRMITRDSLSAELELRQAATAREVGDNADQEDVCSWAAAAARLGVSTVNIDALVQNGALVSRTHRRGRRITIASLEAHERTRRLRAV